MVDYANWSYWNRNYASWKELDEDWDTLEEYTLPQDLSNREAVAKEKRALWLEREKMIKDFFHDETANGKRGHSLTRVEREARLQKVKDFIRQTRLVTQNPPELMRLPIQPDCDPLDVLRDRTEYDERLTVPIEQLLMAAGDQTLAEYFAQETEAGRRFILGKKFYRCPNFYWIQTQQKTTGKNSRSDAMWVGPFECGKILSAFSDWTHRRRGGKGPKNAWDCISCYADWMGKRHGQHSAFLCTYTTVPCLILDAPPEDLLRRWTEERVEFYKRIEPSAPLRDERPVVPRGSMPTQVQFTGEASDKVWAVLLSDLDYQSWRQLEGEHRESSDAFSILTQCQSGTGSMFRTVEETPEGRDAIKFATENTDQGLRLNKDVITPESAKMTWMKGYEVQPGEKIAAKRPVDEVMHEIAGSATPSQGLMEDIDMPALEAQSALWPKPPAVSSTPLDALDEDPMKRRKLVSDERTTYDERLTIPVETMLTGRTSNTKKRSQQLRDQVELLKEYQQGQSKNQWFSSFLVCGPLVQERAGL